MNTHMGLSINGVTPKFVVSLLMAIIGWFVGTTIYVQTISEITVHIHAKANPTTLIHTTST